jgi:hypothetical protein
MEEGEALLRGNRQMGMQIIRECNSQGCKDTNHRLSKDHITITPFSYDAVQPTQQ